mmetsp:Transcript_96354/g.272509  ORF Transcript_96354/g.272509 Transcript_96354/m.272509 type:complete len:350 (+) Transcript_96354:330-1379(+)
MAAGLVSPRPAPPRSGADALNELAMPSPSSPAMGPVPPTSPALRGPAMPRFAPHLRQKTESAMNQLPQEHRSAGFGLVSARLAPKRESFMSQLPREQCSPAEGCASTCPPPVPYPLPHGRPLLGARSALAAPAATKLAIAPTAQSSASSCASCCCNLQSDSDADVASCCAEPCITSSDSNSRDRSASCSSRCRHRSSASLISGRKRRSWTAKASRERECSASSSDNASCFWNAAFSSVCTLSKARSSAWRDRQRPPALFVWCCSSRVSSSNWRSMVSRARCAWSLFCLTPPNVVSTSATSRCQAAASSAHAAIRISTARTSSLSATLASNSRWTSEATVLLSCCAVANS